MFQIGAEVPQEVGREEGGGGRETAEKNNAHFMVLYFCTHPQHNSPNVYHSEKCYKWKLQRRPNKSFMSNTYSNKFYGFEVTEENVWCESIS
jgi:hypothetical protein